MAQLVAGRVPCPTIRGDGACIRIEGAGRRPEHDSLICISPACLPCWADAKKAGNDALAEQIMNRTSRKKHSVDGCTLVPCQFCRDYGTDWAVQEAPAKVRRWSEATITLMKINEGNSMYSNGAIRDAHAEIEADKRAMETADILLRVGRWGDDKYALKTVFRFEKKLPQRHQTADVKAYAYTAIKFEEDRWQVAGDQFGWEAFVFWLVTEGEPVEKADVEIFAPAKFPAADDDVPAYAA